MAIIKKYFYILHFSEFFCSFSTQLQSLTLDHVKRHKWYSLFMKAMLEICGAQNVVSANQFMPH